MRVTILGHAGLLVETCDQQVLVDPVFANQLIGGAIEFSPPRRFDIDRMPVPSVLVITHAHFDHFHPPSLERIARTTPVITAGDPALIEQLSELGFRDIRPLAPWQCVTIGTTTLQATPSDYEEPEFGVVISDASGSLWHMVDSEISPQDVERLVRDRRIDVVATKYQPVVASSMAYLRGLGTVLDKDAVFASLEAACACDPRFVFPYAFGVAFGGPHSWFSRYALAVRPKEIVDLLARRLGSDRRAGTVAPGDEIAITPEAIELRPAASPFVHAVPAELPAWEPVDTASLQGLDSDAERRELAQTLEGLIADELAPWLATELQDPASRMRALIELGVVWQLVVHAGEGQRLCYAINFRTREIELEEGEHPDANLFVHVGGGTLLAVLQRREPELLFWLAGQARIYEKIMDVRDNAFWRPALHGTALFARLPDPLTTYLRLRTRGHRHLEATAS